LKESTISDNQWKVSAGRAGGEKKGQRVDHNEKKKEEHSGREIARKILFPERKKGPDIAEKE